MAYNLMIEFPSPPNWSQISLLASTCRYVEIFPIESDDKNPAAVGVSLPTKNVTPEGWLELKQMLDALRRNFKGLVFDLYRGQAIAVGDDEQIQRALFS